MTQAKVRELRLRNYRAFSDARLLLDDVTFLVGRNGAGKSTLLDAMSFLSEAVTDSFRTAWDRRGGMLGLGPRQLRGEAKANTALAVRIELDDGSNAVYGFEFGFSDARKRSGILREVLSATNEFSFDRSVSSFHSDGTQLNPVLDLKTLVLPLIAGTNELWKKIIEAIRLASVYQLSPEAMRSGPRIGKEERLHHDGGNAGDVLDRLCPAERKWVELRLREAMPGIRGVSTSTVVGRRIIVFDQIRGNGQVDLFDASAMSDGTLRALGILLALRQTPRPSIVLIDEIEDSLHPYAHGVLLDAIEASSEEFPVVVSTHNPEILSHPSAKGERIRIVQWDEGTSNIYSLSKEVLSNLKPPQTVGRLLRSNALWTEGNPSTTGAEADFFKV
ncbi:MAG: AAA family ATPase [Isosphaeraceae bacterium]